MGLDFANPIGLAAGFDKNAEVMHSMFSFGFGFLKLAQLLHNLKVAILNLEYLD